MRSNNAGSPSPNRPEAPPAPFADTADRNNKNTPSARLSRLHTDRPLLPGGSLHDENSPPASPHHHHHHHQASEGARTSRPSSPETQRSPPGSPQHPAFLEHLKSPLRENEGMVVMDEDGDEEESDYDNDKEKGKVQNPSLSPGGSLASKRKKKTRTVFSRSQVGFGGDEKRSRRSITSGFLSRRSSSWSRRST